MSRPIALSALRARVRKLADIGPDTTSASARHPNADINTLINVQWQALRRKLVQTNGARSLYCKAAVATMSPGPTSPYAFGTITAPSDFAHAIGLEIVLSNGKRKSLTPGSWSLRNEEYNAMTQNSGEPREFFIFNIGVETGSAVSAASIGITPAPDAGYQYTLWYLPSWVDRTVDTDVFDGVEGWDEWVVYACVLDIALADNDMAATAQLAGAKLGAVEEDILRSANAIQRTGPICRVDIAGLEQRNRMDSRRWWGIY